jgi:hypothetical protein
MPHDIAIHGAPDHCLELYCWTCLTTVKDLGTAATMEEIQWETHRHIVAAG